MKAFGSSQHSPDTLTTSVESHPPALDRDRTLTVASVYTAHKDFVWASLQRLGGRDADLQDLLQEVFVVVHQRLRDFEGRSLVTTWLFGIALRVVAAHRRRASTRRELPDGSADRGDEPSTGDSPEEAAAFQQARVRLAAILDEMDLPKRAVFVMFEIEDMSCEEMASILGIPVGTVYSRLHAARAQFERIRTAEPPRKAQRDSR